MSGDETMAEIENNPTEFEGSADQPNGDNNEEESPEEETERPTLDLEDLNRALKAGEDISAIKEICTGKIIPVEGMPELWKLCLGVTHKPDALGSWDGPVDLESVQKDCQQAAERLAEPKREAAVMDMQLVIGFYCKSRSVRYTSDNGWAELLVPLAHVGMSRADMYNCFYALLSKYVPKECKPNGLPFHLFRLLLLYHDPELCSFLDTKKLLPDEYLLPWLRSLLVSSCEVDVVCSMWSVYLMERDPFLVFFLVLVILINAKDFIMESPDSDKEKLKEIISSFPQQLSVSDIDDFCSLAEYYAARTPQSFRKDYHGVLFATSRATPSYSTLAQQLCLPIAISEVLESIKEQSECNVKYFVVDCRPLDQYSCGHLPGSYQLDPNLLLHSPVDFDVASERLCSRINRTGNNPENTEHMCFLGSGRELEDQFVHMIVAKYLQKFIPYVSLAKGGFIELHRVLGDQLDKILEDYDADKCHHFLSAEALVEPQATAAIVTKAETTASDSDSDMGLSRSKKLQERGAKLYSSLASGVKERSQRLKQKLQTWLSEGDQPEVDSSKHAKPTDRLGRRYRDLDTNVFSIADEDDNDDNVELSSSDDDLINSMVNISSFTQGEGVLHSFPCSEIKDNFNMPSHIVLMKDELILLRELSDRTGYARVKAKHSVSCLYKITAKKKQPDVITFLFQDDSDGANEIRYRFHIPNSRQFTDKLTAHLQPKKSNDVNSNS